MSRKALILLLGLLLPLAMQAREADSTLLARNAVKTTFMSWFTGSSKIAYERAWPAIHQSSEVTASLICAGYDKYQNHPVGFSVRYAHKFFLAPWKSYGKSTYWQPLSGFYVRPEFMYVDFRYDRADTGARDHSQTGAMLFTAGIQYTFRHFIADAYFGSGYCFGRVADTGYQHGYSVWDYFDHRNDHLAMSFSIKLGYAW